MDAIKQFVLEYLSKNKLSIYFEGEISSGKSTLCRSINEHLSKYSIGYKYYPEPINEKLLALFYSDIKTHAFSFQSITVRERIHIINKAIESLKKEFNLICIDRSLIGDCAFALMHYNSGNINSKQFEVYSDLTKFEKVEYDDIKRVIVYLDCTPEKSRERVIIRGNEQEIKSCTLEYLTDLKNSHLKVLKINSCSQEESIVIDQIYKSLDTNNIITLDYNTDYKLIDGYISEDDIFNLLKSIIDKI